MRTRNELSRHLSTLTQALYFQDAHRKELTEEGRVRLRALEDNIDLLGWCLQEPEPQSLSWADVREAFRSAWRLLWLRLFPPSSPPPHSSGTADPSPDRPREVIR